MFKYSWVWNKINRASNHLNAKRQPLRITEDVCVFYEGPAAYYPIMVPRDKPVRASNGNRSKGTESQIYGAQEHIAVVEYTEKYPTNLINIQAEDARRGLHPSQKPVALMEYLIKTYTLPGQCVLDFAMGSGTTGVACKNTGRRFIGIELDPSYFEIAQKRIAASRLIVS
jgi:site-specific DNA-methyltransferase (adenine-specific)